jgi:hypothetical protein
MEKYKPWLVIPLILILILGSGACFIFYRFYQHDVQALTDFTTAYKNYDQAISEFSAAVLAANHENALISAESERKADEALAALDQKASARISSMIKYEKELMGTMAEVADLSGIELDSLKAYQSAIAGKNADLNQFVQEFGDSMDKRKAAYAHFRELAEK